MPHGSKSLSEIARERHMLRLVCEACGRAGQYRIENLLKRYPGDTALPDLLGELARCPRRGSMSNPCGVRYADIS